MNDTSKRRKTLTEYGLGQFDTTLQPDGSDGTPATEPFQIDREVAFMTSLERLIRRWKITEAEFQAAYEQLAQKNGGE